MSPGFFLGEEIIIKIIIIDKERCSSADANPLPPEKRGEKKGIYNNPALNILVSSYAGELTEKSAVHTITGDNTHKWLKHPARSIFEML
jgi:hypothetical protein